MSECPRCHAALAEGAQFCAGCGLPVGEPTNESENPLHRNDDGGISPQSAATPADPADPDAPTSVVGPLFPPSYPAGALPPRPAVRRDPAASDARDVPPSMTDDSGPLPLPDEPAPRRPTHPQPHPAPNPAAAPPNQPGGAAPAAHDPAAHAMSRTATKSGLAISALNERFAPGTLVASRYRIIARLGKGGMGEVFRADDLVLSQQVAIKFVPDRLASNQAARENFLNEVRVARRVTHANVCRVYDIGEHEGQYFITMEFVDGEDLSNLIKRFGRLSGDRSLKLAKEICAALASAHEQHVLHRDLKPANILIDGRGRAKIADFGLAALAEDLRGDKRRAGTPAYMAPEVLRGLPASPAADIYSLGLLLYELFTATPVFRPQNLTELMGMHDKPVTPPSDVTPDIDPRVERVILACLAREPEDRPSSPLAVLASLPGGDPLAAALEAGLTPSPAVVAAAGAKGLCRPFWIASALGGIVGMVLLLFLVLGPATTLLPRVPLAKTPEVLEDRARDVLEGLGIRADLPHRASALDYYEELVAEMQRRDRTSTRWSTLDRARPSPIDFWYRQSSQPLVTAGPSQRVTMQDPPFSQPGMVSVRLDSAGRLRELLVYTEPEQLDGTPGAGAFRTRVSLEPARTDDPPPDFAPVFTPVFAAAGLDITKFEPIDPLRIPPIYGDRRFAWRGVYPETPDEPIRVEAATLNRQVVAFRIVETNWTAASMFIDTTLSPLTRVSKALANALASAAFLGGLVLAWRNLAAKRSDRAGAFRVALLGLVATALAYLLSADWPASADAIFSMLARCARDSFVAAGLFWMFYIAIEPYVRRTWPETLISWTRLLSGGFRDALVCQHIVMGVLAGCVGTAIFLLDRLTPGLVGKPPPAPWMSPEHGLAAIDGLRHSLGVLADSVVFASRWSITFLVALVLLKLATRNKTAAVIVYTVIQGSIWALDTVDSPLSWLSFFALASLCSFVLVRFGLLALATAAVAFVMLVRFPMAIDTYTWYWPAGVLSILTIAALATFGALGSVGLLGRLPKLAANPGV